METPQEVGCVVRLGEGWVEVDVGGKLRRVALPPNLFTHVGGFVRLRDDQIVSVVGTGQLSPLPEQRQED
ncbi:MAG: hypothetical protein JXB47_18985 [Anaerolineae bacterium]|nr:hypothetical protein [Anaerolineae bacterium]